MSLSTYNQFNIYAACNLYAELSPIISPEETFIGTSLEITEAFNNNTEGPYLRLSVAE